MGEHQHTDPQQLGLGGISWPFRHLGGGDLVYRVPRGRPPKRAAKVVPGVLLEANLSGDREWEDDKDTESREGEALVHVPGGC